MARTQLLLDKGIDPIGSSVVLKVFDHPLTTLYDFLKSDNREASVITRRFCQHPSGPKVP